jgi:hypothetical protein
MNFSTSADRNAAEANDLYSNRLEMTTKKASEPDTRQNTPKTQSPGVTGSAQPSSHVQNCVSSVPGTRRPMKTADGTIS